MDELANGQNRAAFETEAALIAARTQRIERVTPHLKEGNETIGAEQAPLAPSANDPVIEIALPRGSLARGLVLHKLIEELLTGEMPEDLAALETRAVELAAQLDDTPGAATLDGAEAARTVLRGLALPPIQAVRDRLVPECTVASSVLDGEVEWVTLGIADAVVRGADGTLDLVVDWKSDVDPAPATIAQYRAQVGAYLTATGVTAGMIIFLTHGQIEHVRSKEV